MESKKDGFTLVELLATIIILGIILGLAVSAYGIYIQTTKNKAYQNAENVLKVSASNALTHCMTAPTGEFIKFCEVHKAPTNQFEYDIITGDDLIKYDYVDPIVDPNNKDKTCDMSKSYVYISNKANSEEENNNEFVYKVCLVCGDQKSKDCRDDLLTNETSKWDTSCRVFYDEAGTRSYDGKWIDEDLYLKLSSSGDYKYGINQYRYRIGSESWLSAKAKNDIATVHLNKTIGNKEIQVEAYDGVNQKRETVCTSSGGSLIKIDKTIIKGVTITGKQTDGKSVNNGAWSKTDLVLSANMNPKTTPSGYQYTWYKDGQVIEGANKSSYTATLRGTYKVVVTNGVGKQTVTSQDFVVKIDKNKPVCTLKVTGQKSGEWYVGNVSVVIDSMNDLEDDGLLGSGIASSKVSHPLVTTDSAALKVTGTVIDNVGRVGTCETIIKRDTQTPSSGLKQSPLSLGNGDYDMKNNLNPNFGPSGGTITCDPATSRKTGTYNVTCTLVSNANGKTGTISFMVRHSYPATYNPRTCYDEYQCNCRTERYCLVHYPCDPWQCTCGSYPTGCCTQHFGSTCEDDCHEGTKCDTCTSSRDCSYYTCPNGGSLSGSTCVY